jgi:putative oxidoreductase
MTAQVATVETPFHPEGRWSLSQLLQTDASLAQTFVRLVLAGVLFPHGAQHALGWFGGYGFAGTLQWMTGTLGFAAPLAALGIVVELLAPIALVAGIGSRLASLALAVFMATAASTHLPNGFFMNWFGALPAGREGFEYHLLAVTLALIVFARGGGAFSTDRLLARR